MSSPATPGKRGALEWGQLVQLALSVKPSSPFDLKIEVVNRSQIEISHLLEVELDGSVQRLIEQSVLSSGW
jgi:hypothetical protein